MVDFQEAAESHKIDRDEEIACIQWAKQEIERLRSRLETSQYFTDMWRGKAVQATNEADILRQQLGDNRWFSVNKAVPMDGERVLAFFPAHGTTPATIMEATFRGSPLEFKWLTEHGSWFYASHWRPFPEPPTEVR